MADARILIVAADQPAAAGGLAELLPELGSTVCAAIAPARRGAADRAADAAARTAPDLALIDLDRAADGSEDGVLEAAERLAGSTDVPVVYLTDGADDSRLRRARRTTPFGFVLKPFAARQLQLTIESALALRDREREHRRAIAESVRRARLLEAVCNGLSDGVMVTEADGRFLFVNPAAERALGIGAADTPAERWAENHGTFYPDGKTPFPAQRLPLARALRGEFFDDVEMVVRNRHRPDGVHINVTARPLPAAGTGVHFRDITTLKGTEAKLRRTIDDLQRQTHLMETVFDSLSDGVVVADGRGTISLFNQSAERILGNGKLAVGPDGWSRAYRLFHPDRVTPFATEDLPLVRAIRGEASDDVEMYLRHPAKPDGGAYVSVSGRPLAGKDGDGGGVIVFHDVTERMLAQEAVSQAFAQGRLEVVETILHNIGNAINSVTIGVGTIRQKVLHNEVIHRTFALADVLLAHQDDWITYLRDDPQGQQVMPFIFALTKDLRGWHDGMRTTVERVESRVAHIVDIIRTQRSFDYETAAVKDVELRPSILAAVRILDDPLTRRGIDLRVDCRRAPRQIRIAESAFHQMLVNLVRNGIEAIDRRAGAGAPARPRLRIDAYRRREAGRGEELVLEVIDNGIGIEPERAAMIFSAGYTTKEGGSGIGLHSAANFANSCGGSIEALSAGIGAGTTIRIILPAGDVAA